MKTQRIQNRSALTDRGFTLIEVLVAIAIFAIGILAVAKMQYWTFRNNSTGDKTTQATMLARQKIEEIKSQDIEDMADGNDSGGIYTREWGVAEPPGCPAGCSARRIVVTVSWDQQGQTRSIELTTITRGNGT